MSSLFKRLERPAPTEATSTSEKTQSIERLLNWLTNNWTKDTITVRQLITYGPYPLRNETKAALELADGLAVRGWIWPIEPERRDVRTRKWKIGRNFQRP
jgi:hypothetical protein